MTLKGYFTWFKENWAETGVIVGVFLTIYLIVIVLPQNTLLFALMMYTPLYMLHEAEEYIFPGGFAPFLNNNIYRTQSETDLLDPTAVLWINMVVWIAFPLYSLWAITDLTQAAWMPYFVIFQAVLHLVLGVIGKRLLNPGMVSAWLVHVPWGIWTIWLLMRAGEIVNPYWNEYSLEGLEIILAMAVVGFILWIRYKRRLPQR
ncbi:MAG TPA: HXXEE domain-containing protein [Longilinea sp.]|nr:HXXEE domain-containing protein [Longilinea sp.]